MRQNLIAILNLLCVSLFVCSTIIFTKEPYFAGLCMGWSVAYFIKTNKHIVKIKAFTLIELIAVIAISGIILSILISVRTSHTKSDSIRLKSLLMQAKTYSYKSDTPVKFELDGNYRSTITQSEDLYLKDGVPTDQNGNPLIGFQFLNTG